MTLQEIMDYCLKKKCAYLDFPFGAEFAIIKVKAPSQDSGRIFAQIFELKGAPVTTFTAHLKGAFIIARNIPTR